jgi:hypothetical protein
MTLTLNMQNDIEASVVLPSPIPILVSLLQGKCMFNTSFRIDINNNPFQIR